ncbi:MAG: helix-turn-helix domain-containing protein [Saprospiraceae bacterium]
MFLWILAVFSGLLFLTGISLIIRSIPYCFKLLGSNLLLMSLVLLNTYVHLGGLMVHYPFLFRTAAPLGYLLGPTYYFFVLSATRQHFKFRASHLLHLLPFLLNFADLLPFFLLPGEAKKALYEAYINLPQSTVLSSQVGYFSFRAHNMFKFLIGLGYVLASAYAVWSIPKGQYSTSAFVSGKILVWIKTDVLLRILILLLTLIIYVGYKNKPELLLQVHYVIFSLGCVSSALMLIFFPEVLFPEFSSPVSNENIEGGAMWGQNLDSSPFTTEKDPEENSFFTSLRQGLEQIYSDKDADVQSLAKILHLSERSLYRKTKEASNKTPAQLLTDFRMEKAYALIQRDPEKPIATVAIEVGLVSNGYFAAAFSERFGILPRDLQKRCRSRSGDHS